MCGLIGIFGKIGPNQLDIFDEMFQLNVLRGTDSCGIAVIKGAETEIIKDVMWPDDLLVQEEYTKAIADQEAITGLIGHNRAQTRGKVSPENAHPFKIENITLAHNGTVRTFRFPGPDKETDSETICNHINKSDIDQVWKWIEGAAALAYHDKRTSKMYLATNGQRPLGFLIHDGVMYFASEPWMIVTAFYRMNIKIKLDQFWVLDKNKLYEFDIVDGKVQYTARKLEEYTAPPYDYSNRRNGYYMHGDWYRDEYGIGYDEWDETHAPRSLLHHESCNCSACCERRREAIMANVKQKEEEKSEDAPFNTPLSPAQSLSAIHKIASLNINSREKRGMTEADFRKHYHDCSFCGGSLENDFKHSVIINHQQRDALCGVCATQGELIVSNNNNVKESEVTVH